MTADNVHRLPISSADRERLCTQTIVKLSMQNQLRLRRRATAWNVSAVEAAEMILADVLNPKARRRQRKLVSPEIAMSMALSATVEGAPSLIGPHGKVVTQLKEALRLTGYRIEPI